MKSYNLINNLSEHLFWDVDVRNINEQKHKKYIVTKVLQYGLYSDWKQILKLYGLKIIINISINIKDLDDKTLSFLSLIIGVRKFSKNHLYKL